MICLKIEVSDQAAIRILQGWSRAQCHAWLRRVRPALYVIVVIHPARRLALPCLRLDLPCMHQGSLKLRVESSAKAWMGGNST